MRSVLAAILVGLLGQATLSAEERPNFLWIVFEDIGPDIGPYGDRYASTPHLDRFAAEGVVFERAFSNGGACAPARSTLITGMYPPAIGTHHMRSRGGPAELCAGLHRILAESRLLHLESLEDRLQLGASRDNMGRDKPRLERRRLAATGG